MERLLLTKWMVALLLFIKGIAYSVAIDVREDSSVTIQCPLNIEYPIWTGPEGLANPLTDGQNITEPGIEWVNNTDLKIATVMLKHDGNYTCSDGIGNSKTVEVDVQYFSARAEFTPATPENTTTVLTCWCHSNPTCKIVPHTFTHIRPGQDINPNSTITFNPCGPDPFMENKTKCGVVAVMHVSKEDNGLKMSCEFEYKNSTTMTLYPKVKVIFPPTLVNITAGKENSKLTLNCSTDSSNPVSSLTWRRGIRPQASDNAFIRSSYKSYAMDAEYNGKNITQAIDIEAESIRNGEKVFCCAQHGSNNVCDSMALDSYQISGGHVVTAWMTALFVGIAFYLVWE